MLRRCNTRRNRGLPAADLRLAPLGLAPGLSSLGPSCRRAPTGIGPIAAPLSAPSPWPCFLLLRRGLPLRRTWIEQPYGEEEITLLEEEVIPAIQQCLARVDELDKRLLAQQQQLQRCQLEAERRALGALRLQMA